MAELKCLDGYSGQSTDELIALEGEYRTDSLVLTFEQAVEQKVMKCDITDKEAVIPIIEWLEREVNNGGYHQFFVNTKLEAVLAVDALNLIGCPKVADLTQQAIDALAISGDVTVEALDVIHRGEERTGVDGQEHWDAVRKELGFEEEEEPEPEEPKKPKKKPAKKKPAKKDPAKKDPAKKLPREPKKAEEKKN